MREMGKGGVTVEEREVEKGYAPRSLQIEIWKRVIVGDAEVATIIIIVIVQTEEGLTLHLSIQILHLRHRVRMNQLKL
jgi:hypothetical protein